MLIRHISIPRHSHLVSLVQPKQREEQQETQDFSMQVRRTLNPEEPILDALISTANRPSKVINQADKTEDNNLNELPSFLMKESPQKIDEFPFEAHHSPKKQIYSTRGEDKKHKERVDRERMNGKLTNKYMAYVSLTPQLTNQAYMKPLRRDQDEINRMYVNNSIYLTNRRNQKQDEEAGQEESLLRKNHLSSPNEDALFRTLEKFRSRKVNHEEQLKLSSKKKYSFSLPKHTFAYSQAKPQMGFPAKQEVVLPPPVEEEAKATKKILFTRNKKEKDYMSNLVLGEKKRRGLPEQEEQNQTSRLIFNNKSKDVTITLRPASQQDKIPKTRHQSELAFSNKKLKHRKIEARDPPTPLKLQVSYKTSLLKLKEICSTNNLQNCEIIMKIPQIFSYPMFSGNEQQEQLFEKAEEVLKHLQIATKSEKSIKKYSNCIVILTGNIGLIWHFTGKVYLGGWKNEFLDEGTKNGLGLEWYPKKYVYYGEFSKNKKQGLGIMKTNSNEVLAGIWRDNHYIRSLNEERR